MNPATACAWLPLLTLPTVVVILTPTQPRWVFMWLLAFAIYVGCKWLTWRTTPARGTSLAKQFGYLLAWPGLDAPAFFHTPSVGVRPLSDWLFALAKLALGIAIVMGLFPLIPVDLELFRGWVGMIGVLFVLHFGVFHLLSLTWRAFGITARPIMDWPMLANSVRDFWGKRWNSAFRDLTHRYLFRPLTTHFGARTALLVGFIFSGLVHELVVSVPAGGGYGGPTLFFLLQAVGLLLERSALGQRIGLANGIRGWAFTMLMLLGPVGLLFHRPFVCGVVVPFLDWINVNSGVSESIPWGRSLS